MVLRQVAFRLRIHYGAIAAANMEAVGGNGAVMRIQLRIPDLDGNDLS